MLKKNVLVTIVTACGLVAQGVYADDRGVESGKSTTYNRADACDAAKKDADLASTRHNLMANPVRITGHSACDCSKDNSIDMWTCTVDANWELHK